MQFSEVLRWGGWQVKLLPWLAALLLALPAGHALAAHARHAAAHPAQTAGKTRAAKAAKPAKPTHGKPAAKKQGRAGFTPPSHPSVAQRRGKPRPAALAAPQAPSGPSEHVRHEPPAVSAGAPRALLEHPNEGHAAVAAPGDPVALQSGAALVIDQDTGQTLLAKNDHAVQPIASLTKLMTGLIIADAALPMDEPVAITGDDVDTEKGSRSRLGVGATLTRGELLHLALMSSENRAAHALGRTYPGGMSRFVALMNARAIMLGMKDTHYVEPTGLSSANRSSAADLAILVAAAHENPLLRQLSTTANYEVATGDRLLEYKNTNRLVRDPQWDIGLQKTGYISEAGHCLVMQTRIAGHQFIMVFLDSSGKFSRIADAERVRRWIESRPENNSASAKAAPSAEAG